MTSGFKCNCCGAEFDEPERYREYHGEFDRAPEIWSCCPACGSADFWDAWDADDWDDWEDAE